MAMAARLRTTNQLGYDKIRELEVPSQVAVASRRRGAGSPEQRDGATGRRGRVKI